jgi:hypothetical protein
VLAVFNDAKCSWGFDGHPQDKSRDCLLRFGKRREIRACSILYPIKLPSTPLTDFDEFTLGGEKC